MNHTKTQRPGLFASIHFRTVAVALMATTIVGCASVGPGTVTRDRFDYSTTIADSWKQQTLLNIVKLRYMDLPIFLDVGQIVAGYTVERSGSLSAAISRGDDLDSNAAGLGGGVRYTDRPTITYTPLTGDSFLRGLMAPIRPGAVFALLQSGYAADFVLSLSLESLKGLHNPVRGQAAKPLSGSDAFARALALFREIQIAGALNFRIEIGAQGEETVVFFRRQDMPSDVIAQIEELRGLLGAEESDGRYRLVFSPVPAGEGELAVHTRSMLQILLALAETVDIPQQHIAENRALGATLSEKDQLPLIVRSGPNKPEGAYTAVMIPTG